MNAITLNIDHLNRTDFVVNLLGQRLKTLVHELLQTEMLKNVDHLFQLKIK